MGEIRDYSVTADDNNDTPPAGAPEGMAPSTVNNTMREAYARIKRWYEDCQGAKTTGGSSNAYTLAAARTVASYAAGDSYMFKANHTNTSAGSTLNVDSVGAKAIVTPTGAAIAAGSITSGGVYLVAYEASVDKFMLIGGSHSGGDNPFIYNSSPTLTLENSTSEDTSGGRESQVVFKGLQSGGEESTLVKIQASHEGTSDDEKGQLIVGVNDGNDGASPTTAVTVASTGIVTFDKMPITPNPTMRVHRNDVDQSLPDTTVTKVQFTTEDWDIGGYFDNSTNYRWTPLVQGYYLINLSVRLNSSVDTFDRIVYIYKNGAVHSVSRTRMTGGGTNKEIGLSNTLCTDYVYLDGVDDYVEGYVYVSSLTGSTNTIEGAGVSTYMSGALISRTG